MATVKQIQHEDYVAEVSYSAEDSCYYAQLVNAPGLSLLAEGETLEDLLEAFSSLVDDYLKAVSDDDFGLVQPRTLTTV
jgi:predicted RNase H-like HicB family nuclease